MIIGIQKAHDQQWDIYRTKQAVEAVIKSTLGRKTVELVKENTDEAKGKLKENKKFMEILKRFGQTQQLLIENEKFVGWEKVVQFKDSEIFKTLDKFKVDVTPV